MSAMLPPEVGKVRASIDRRVSGEDDPAQQE